MKARLVCRRQHVYVKPSRMVCKDFERHCHPKHYPSCIMGPMVVIHTLHNHLRNHLVPHLVQEPDLLHLGMHHNSNKQIQQIRLYQASLDHLVIHLDRIQRPPIHLSECRQVQQRKIKVRSLLLQVHPLRHFKA